MAILAPQPRWRSFTRTGQPLSGGQLLTEVAGTSTPLQTYTTPDESTANDNPVTLDAYGEADVWLLEGRSYKLTLRDSAGVQQWSIDNITGIGSASSVFTTVDNVAALRALGAGAFNVVQLLGYNTINDGGQGLFRWNANSSETDNGGTVFLPTGHTGIGRYERVFEGLVNVQWFGAVGNYTEAGGGTDNTNMFNAALALANTENLGLRVPAGSYLLSGALNCAVPMFGDVKGQVVSDAQYGVAAWNTDADLNRGGSCLIWDKSTLAVTDNYIRNVSGVESQKVEFQNLSFYSLSEADVGGGKLLTVDASQTGEEYDFGELPTFKNCNITNFGTAITLNVYNSWNFSNVTFKGCLQPILAGNNTPEIAANINIKGVTFENCGDTSTPFIVLDNVTGFRFLECQFSKTSNIQLRIATGQGVSFVDCFANDASLGSSGDFINISSTTGFNVDNVSFIRCFSGGAMGNINLVQGPNEATLSLMDSQLTGATIATGTGTVTVQQFGQVSHGGTTGSGQINQFSAGRFDYDGIVLVQVGTDKIIRTDSDENRLVVTAGTDATLSTGAQVELNGDDETSGSAHVTISSGNGDNPGNVRINAPQGDIELTPGSSNNVNIIAGDLDIDEIGKGLRIAEGANAKMGTATLVAGTITVNTTAVSTSSRLFITRTAFNATSTAGNLNVSAIVNGTSFTVQSSIDSNPGTPNINDVSSFNWHIIDPTS